MGRRSIAAVSRRDNHIIHYADCAMATNSSHSKSLLPVKSYLARLRILKSFQTPIPTGIKQRFPTPPLSLRPGQRERTKCFSTRSQADYEKRVHPVHAMQCTREQASLICSCRRDTSSNLGSERKIVVGTECITNKATHELLSQPDKHPVFPKHEQNTSPFRRTLTKHTPKPKTRQKNKNRESQPTYQIMHNTHLATFLRPRSSLFPACPSPLSPSAAPSD